MRKDKKECKKGQETTIGKIIYGFLLFMPLLAIGVTCGYAIFNKNAYQSYSNERVQNVTTINSNNLLQNNNTYSVNELLIAPSNVETPIFHYKSTTVDWSLFGAPDTYNYDSFKLRTGIGTANKFIFLYENGIQVYENHTSLLNYFNDRLPFTFVLDSYEGGSTGWYDYFNFSLVTYSYGKLSDIFYYAVDKVTESPLFNWAENSIIYTTMSSTCTALSITTTFIPLLLSYWLIISVIYFLYDIALMLIWLIHRKIHELQETI